MIYAHVAALALGEAGRTTLTRRCPNCSLKQLAPEEKIHGPMRFARVRKSHPSEGIETTR